jgi:hypothetical protein
MPTESTAAAYEPGAGDYKLERYGESGNAIPINDLQAKQNSCILLRDRLIQIGNPDIYL